MKLIRTELSHEQELFKRTVAQFMKELLKREPEWERNGIADRATWLEAGELGLLGPTVPEAYGGLGLDRRYSAIVLEEQARALLSGPGFNAHSNMTVPYITRYGSEEQKQRWLPKTVTGEIITALAMTEPDTGSDLQNIRTTAVKVGDDYVINGSKTFITNGISADLIVVACKTDPSLRGKGISMIAVEADREGFRKGKNLNKLGLKTQDTGELFFDNVRVPQSNRLGEEGKGFAYMMEELSWERLQTGIWAAGTCEALIDATVEYTENRKAFGKSIAEFQNTRFKLAEAATQTQILRILVDRCMDLMCENKLDATTAAMVKYWSSDLLNRVADECLQLHGGNGFMWEYPVCRAYADARIHRIWAGTNEIMKEIIARSLFQQ